MKLQVESKFSIKFVSLGTKVLHEKLHEGRERLMFEDLLKVHLGKDDKNNCKPSACESVQFVR